MMTLSVGIILLLIICHTIYMMVGIIQDSKAITKNLKPIIEYYKNKETK